MYGEKGYDNYSSGLFEKKDSPFIDDWRVMSRGKLPHVIEYFGSRGMSVVSYECRDIPNNYKRGPMDNARLLVLFLENGEVMCKRHNNSQWLNLRD